VISHEGIEALGNLSVPLACVIISFVMHYRSGQDHSEERKMWQKTADEARERSETRYLEMFNKFIEEIKELRRGIQK